MRERVLKVDNGSSPPAGPTAPFTFELLATGLVRARPLAGGVVYESETFMHAGTAVPTNTLTWPELQQLHVVAKNAEEFIWRVNRRAHIM